MNKYTIKYEYGYRGRVERSTEIVEAETLGDAERKFHRDHWPAILHVVEVWRPDLNGTPMQLVGPGQACKWG